MLLVWPRLVVVRMTGCTVGLERRELPVDELRVRLMAIGAQLRATVIERLVGQPGMTIVRRRPRVRVVTQTAVLRSVEVPRILAGRNGAVVAG